MPEVSAFMPNESELFPEEAMTILDLRDLQRNPVFKTVIQRLRGAAYRAGIEKDPQVTGIITAISIIGFTEFDIQREAEKPEEAPGIDADEIGFTEDS
jgi:hypothetical protein